mgnify:CR=1 FL=1
MNVIFRENAAETIALAGIVQSRLAELAGIDRHHLNRRITKRTALRLVTAGNIARAYAELANITQQAAFELLFEQDGAK